MVGLAAEVVALATDTTTLSSTWFWIRSSLPTVAAIVLSAILGGVLLWLLSVHWIFSGVDRPGFDTAEKMFVIIGAILGTVGGALSTKSRHRTKEEP